MQRLNYIYFLIFNRIEKLNIGEAQDGKSMNKINWRSNYFKYIICFYPWSLGLDYHAFFSGKITKAEFPNTNILGIDGYFYKLQRLHPKHRDRYSEQTWVSFGRSADKNKTMSRILKRYEEFSWFVRSPYFPYMNTN